MILIFALACGKYSRNVGRLLEVHPHATHGVVHARKYFHRRVSWIVPDELLVNFQNTFQLAIQNLPVNMRQVEIYHRLAIDAEVVFINDFEYGAGGDIARNQVAVLRVPLLQKIPALAFRNRFRIARIA